MLSIREKSEIKRFLEKYEKYFNFQDSQNFEDKIFSISNDICKKIKIDIEKCGEAESYIRELYNLSDGEGLSFVLTPGPNFQYTQSDQVQRFHY
jgi:hypothetical protein